MLSLTGCDERIHTPRLLEEWGRASRVGTASHSTQVGLAVAPDGQRIVMTWTAKPEGQEKEYIHLFALDGQGQLVTDQNLEPPIKEPRQVQAFLGPKGYVHIVWSAGSRDARAVCYAMTVLPAPGTRRDLAWGQRIEPRRLSARDTSVRWYKAHMDTAGDMLILWIDDKNNLLGTRISTQAGAGNQPPVDAQIPEARILLRNVLDVDFQRDEVGNGHLVWSVQASAKRLALYKATLDPDTLRIIAPWEAATVVLGRRSTVDTVSRPLLSLEDDESYLSWTQQLATLGTTMEQIYTFPMPLADQPDADETHMAIGIPPTFPPSVAPTQGYFAYQALAEMSSGSQLRTTSVNHAPATVQGQHPEVALVLTARYATRSREEYQPTVVYLKDGAPLGYQVLTWTDFPSLNPTITTDAQQHLYVAWVDVTGQAGVYPIYLASTAPALHTTWERLTWNDYLAIALDMVNRMASSVALFPLTIIWFLLPFPWLMLVLSKGAMYGNEGRQVYWVAMVIYLGAKYLLTEQMLTHLPSLAYLPPAQGALVAYLVPLAILTISLIIGRGITKLRRAEFNVLQIYLITHGVDWILSTFIYAIGQFE
jgi:hypothetical protein